MPSAEREPSQQRLHFNSYDSIQLFEYSFLSPQVSMLQQSAGTSTCPARVPPLPLNVSPFDLEDCKGLVKLRRLGTSIVLFCVQAGYGNQKLTVHPICATKKRATVCYAYAGLSLHQRVAEPQFLRFSN